MCARRTKPISRKAYCEAKNPKKNMAPIVTIRLMAIESCRPVSFTSMGALNWSCGCALCQTDQSGVWKAGWCAYPFDVANHPLVVSLLQDRGEFLAAQDKVWVLHG